MSATAPHADTTGRITGPSTHNRGPRPASAGHVLGLSVGLTALLCLLVIAFAWPATQLAPRSLPIVVAGPAEATAQIGAALDKAAPGGFAVSVVPDEATARAAIERRDAYGAVVLGETPSVLTASAASPVVAQLLTQIATTLEARQGGATPAVRVVDVVPLPATDPRGVGLAALSLPLVIGGLLVGGALTTAIAGIGRRVLGVFLTAVFAGLALTGIAHSWLGVLDGGWWAEAGVIALGIAAVGATLVGLEALFGFVGLVLGAAVIMLIGNPFSGMTSAPEMLPPGWSTVGQWLPPGAAGTLLRSVSFFDGAGGARPLLILGGWVVFGLLLAAFGSRVRRREAGQSAKLDPTGRPLPA